VCVYYIVLHCVSYVSQVSFKSLFLKRLFSIQAHCTLPSRSLCHLVQNLQELRGRHHTPQSRMDLYYCRLFYKHCGFECSYSMTEDGVKEAYISYVTRWAQFTIWANNALSEIRTHKYSSEERRCSGASDISTKICVNKNSVTIINLYLRISYISACLWRLCNYVIHQCHWTSKRDRWSRCSPLRIREVTVSKPRRLATAK
jgi:hypothetical protein